MDDKKNELEQDGQTIQDKIQQKKQSEKEAGKKVAHTAGKAASEYFAPGVGGKLYDAASKMPALGNRINKAEEKLGKQLNRNPVLRNTARKLNDSGTLDAADKAIDTFSASGGQAPKTSGSAPTSSMNLDEGSSANGDSFNPFNKLGGSTQDSSSDVSGEIDVTTRLTNFASKHKLKIIIGASVFLLISFIILIIGGAVVSFADGTVEFFRDAWDSVKKFVTGDKTTQEWELKYYETLDEVQEELNRKYGVCIDVNLITATLTVNVAGDHYIYDGKEEETDTPDGSELGLTGADYKKMIKHIELLGNMQIRRTIYGLDEEVKRNNSGTGIFNDYCNEDAREYVFGEDGRTDIFRAADFNIDYYGFFTPTLNILKRFDLAVEGTPIRDSTSPRLIASNDIEPGLWKFFTKKANEEKNIEYKFFVPAYSYEPILNSAGEVIGEKKVCDPYVPSDSYDFAKLDIGSLNDMENNVYYWNLMDSFIADYYKEFLPDVGGPTDVGSENYEKIKNIVEDIYLLYHEMGPSRMCESAGLRNYCSYTFGDQSMYNVSVQLLQCADGNRFDPIENEPIVDLETYITGVVYAENGGSSNYEALKAQAVAARTYALTNYDEIEADPSGNTIIKLRNCTERQVYCDPNNGCWSNSDSAGKTVYSGQDDSKLYSKPPLPQGSMVWSAVRETAGEVLYDENGSMLSIGYTSTEQNKWNSSSSDYQSMLMDTYAMASSMSSNCVAVGDIVGSATQIGDFTSKACDNYSNNTKYWGHKFNHPQCTWYAFGRGLQILVENAGMNMEAAKSLLSSMFVPGESADGGTWYEHNANTKKFNASTNIDAAREGAFIVWSSGPNSQYPDQHTWGHVAVVEKVVRNDDGTVNHIVTNDGNCDGSTCCDKTRYKSDNFGQKSSYKFVGYIYLLG